MELIVVPSSAGGNSSLEQHSQSTGECATLDRYDHFHGHWGICAWLASYSRITCFDFLTLPVSLLIPPPLGAYVNDIGQTWRLLCTGKVLSLIASETMRRFSRPSSSLLCFPWWMRSPKAQANFYLTYQKSSDPQYRVILDSIILPADDLGRMDRLPKMASFSKGNSMGLSGGVDSALSWTSSFVKLDN
jgi:hypothetical protein